MVPGFFKAGIVTNGVEDQALRGISVMRSARLDSYGKLKQEVFDVARAKSALDTACADDQGKAKDQGKGKDNGTKKKDS